MVHEQFEWATVKLPKSYLKDSIDHLPFLLPLFIFCTIFSYSISKHADSALKGITIAFFTMISITIVAFVNHYWHEINRIRGGKLTSYLIDDTHIIINNKTKIPLSAIDKNSTLQLINSQCKPYAQWNIDHQPNFKPFELNLLVNGQSTIIRFPTEYELQRLLRSLKEYYTNDI